MNKQDKKWIVILISVGVILSIFYYFSYLDLKTDNAEHGKTAKQHE